MVNSHEWTVAAEVYKTFLSCATRIARSEGATITSYDGDRIMGIFAGEGSGLFTL
jgi:class 3 adenylate cyclase